MTDQTAPRRAFNSQMAQLEKWIEIMAVLTMFATTLLLYVICGRTSAAVSSVVLVVAIANLPNRLRQIAARRRAQKLKCQFVACRISHHSSQEQKGQITMISGSLVAIMV
jgi:hypothetical protein